MPAFIAMLLGGLLNIAGSLVGRVLIALGLSVATFSGLSATLSWAKTNVLTSFTSLPPEVVGMLSALGVGEFLSILLSAVAARLLLQGLTDGSMKKWVLR